jgi:hypothetical protein
MICFATLFFRGLFFFFAVRDSVNQAAKASSFTLDSPTAIPPVVSATTTAKTVFARDIVGWPGVSGTLGIIILIKPVPTGAATTSSTALAANSVTTSNMYFIRGTGTGSIQPLFSVGQFMGLNVPGLTGPYPLTILVDAYVENPNGLTN